MARILVIEDEPSIRSNLLRFARLEGHEVMEAADGRAGLEALSDLLPDLIFCDVTMPQMSGLQVLAALQLDAILKLIPFIFISASAEPERLQEAVRLGARDYITKPFNLAQLRAVLHKYLPDHAP
jgi:CheY-like chemotaxis protein